MSSSNPAIAQQILAYAEYRIFAVLARYDGVRGAQVVLLDEADGGLRCWVTIHFESAPSVRARVRGGHTAGTIDRAAERVVELMHRRFQPEILAASN